MHKNLYKVLLILFLFQLPVITAAQEDRGEAPDRIVRDVINNVLKVLDDPDMDEKQKRQIVYGLASRHIDFEEMSRRILAVYWKQTTDLEKIKFMDLFEQTLLNNYWVRIRQYSGEKVKYIATSYDQLNHATVDTVIERENNEVVIPVTYRMKFNGAEWLAYDFLVENLSLVQNY
ncbi:MAG: ABC transporter substrate-binding protein, partial [Gammaproteobacteria bacterium]|nr:ABC transporter substrate-binding protein [Gammaproteobacteria bacterium]